MAEVEIVDETDKSDSKLAKQHKCTVAEISERIAFTARLLAQETDKGTIKKRLKERFKVEWRQCDRYVARARALLAEVSGRSREEWREVVLERIHGLLTFQANTREQTELLKLLIFMLGLNAPLKHEHEHGGKDGGPIQITTIEVQKPAAPVTVEVAPDGARTDPA